MAVGTSGEPLVLVSAVGVSTVVLAIPSPGYVANVKALISNRPWSKAG
ncbi:hypothetical protein P3T27_004388 [Kitasatospora sp. MAA19]|nr:hypothetical protein [Kitasatospora sp. MAA19]MDH6707651.1 hypothetical protein [Kitasatospora sp. MAA19]